MGAALHGVMGLTTLNEQFEEISSGGLPACEEMIAQLQMPISGPAGRNRVKVYLTRTIKTLQDIQDRLTTMEEGCRSGRKSADDSVAA